MSSSATLEYKQAADNHNLDHLPGDYGWPVLGHNVAAYQDLYGLVDRHYKKYGPVARFALAGFRGVLLTGPDIYQMLHLDKEKNFSAEMGYAGSLGRFYRGALLLRDHDEHRYHRRLMQTAFKNDAMRGYMGSMNPVIDTALEQWDGIDNFHFVPHIKQVLLDVAAKIFVGLENLDERAEKLNKAFLDVANGLTAIVTKEIPGGKFKKGKDGERYLQQFFSELIAQRREGDGADMYSYLCREKDENGEYFSDEDIIRHMTFLLFAAHDTTTSALSHLVMYLGKHPEWQDRLREEILSFDKDELEYADLENMPLCDAAVKESLRMHPSVMLMQRRTIRDCEIAGHHIPANTIIFTTPQYVHHMPEFWTEPHRFDPDRWLEPRNEHKNHSFNFVGFGGGAHKCIGMHFALMQSKVVLHQFLRRYRCETPPAYQPKMQTIPLPKPADDLPLTLHRL